MSTGFFLKLRDPVAYRTSVVKKKMPPDIHSFFVAMGRKGGKIGGRALAAKLTPEQRKENARKAVLARWAKVKKTG
jgi:hypothetical protein